MPEGDTIHRLAAQLAPLLVDRPVRALFARRIANASCRTVVGSTIARVEARGKNLLVVFDDDRALHVHLKMHGRVFVRRATASGGLGGSGDVPDLLLIVDGAEVVGRDLPICRLLRPKGAERLPALQALGPDLAAPSFDEGDALARMQALGPRPIGEALLVQRAVAGIGNVYKSEVLFLEGVHPSRPTATLNDAALAAILQRAHLLLRQNLRPGRRTTRNALRGPRLWVYGRAGRPCLRCGAPIERYLLGERERGRSTYVCQSCQA